MAQVYLILMGVVAGITAALLWARHTWQQADDIAPVGYWQYVRSRRNEILSDFSWTTAIVVLIGNSVYYFLNDQWLFFPG